MATYQDRTPNALMPKIGLGLTIVLFTFYAGFILLAAFAPAILAKPIDPGSHITFAFVYGLAVTLSTIVLAAVYVLIANLTD